ncbi:MAG: RtcB family protein [Gemmatimonadetes bacterium]|nr:RtcB family protein [Gemmatimonadota bacterium]
MHVFGQHEKQTLAQLARVAKRADHAALMADGHLGYVMPIGGVAAYRNQVSVAGVGFDIACGNAAVRTDLRLEDLGGGRGGRRESGLQHRLADIADEIQHTLTFGVGGVNRSREAPKDHSLFDDPAWNAVPAHHRAKLKDKARAQLGTVGSGNHYVDVFADERDRVWVGVHFGSRGFGHTVASSFLAIGQGAKWGTRVPEAEVIFDLDAPAGHDYWALMKLAGRYAYAGREWAVRKAVEIIGGREVELVHNHHNFAWEEEHFGRTFVVVRKGATPAFPGQKGFVGGSMGDDAVILEGTGAAKADRNTAALQTRALYSTVHGAGRVMSRTAARGKRHRRTGKVLKRGKVSRAMMLEWVGRRGVVLRGGGLDESPHVYRRLTDVLAAQGDTVRVLHTLRPLVVVMAGGRR